MCELEEQIDDIRLTPSAGVQQLLHRTAAVRHGEQGSRGQDQEDAQQAQEMNNLLQVLQKRAEVITREQKNSQDNITVAQKNQEPLADTVQVNDVSGLKKHIETFFNTVSENKNERVQSFKKATGALFADDAKFSGKVAMQEKMDGETKIVTASFSDMPEDSIFHHGYKIAQVSSGENVHTFLVSENADPVQHANMLAEIRSRSKQQQKETGKRDSEIESKNDQENNSSRLG